MSEILAQRDTISKIRKEKNHEKIVSQNLRRKKSAFCFKIWILRRRKIHMALILFCRLRTQPQGGPSVSQTCYQFCQKVLAYRSSSESWLGLPEAECAVVPWRAHYWDQWASHWQETGRAQRTWSINLRTIVRNVRNTYTFSSARGGINMARYSLQNRDKGTKRKEICILWFF